MSIDELPDQIHDQFLQPGDPCLIGGSVRTHAGPIIACVEGYTLGAWGHTSYSVVRPDGTVFHDADLAPCTPANLAYIAQECQRAHDRRYADYRAEPQFVTAEDCAL